MAEGRFSLAAFAFCAVFALSACREQGADGEYFEVSGRMFVFNYRLATAHYLVTLRPMRPVGSGQKAVVRFENPAGGDDIETSRTIWPRSEKLVLESPPVECVVKDRPYRISIAIEDAGGEVLQRIETTLKSSEDQSVLPDRPLVVGPFYTPNPDVAGHPDGRVPGGRGVTCPTQ
ncbi:hypothetical protein QBK99_18170 [Corticibacterium sp. UT-5YL-CI-8]|nr:hypothetical protein [Tianweitania sp. UT-5YL-CI-8]